MKARHPELVRLDLPANYTYLHLLSDCVADMLKTIDGLNDAELLIYNIQLAGHEACTNIVNHAYEADDRGRINIDVLLRFDPPQITIELEDTGKPFDPEKYTSPNLDEVRIHGYGLFLIRNLMDSVTYTSTQGRNRWCLLKNLFVEGM